MPYQNRNICRSFNQALATNIAKLSAQDCSEVIIYNAGTAAVLVYDNGFSGAAFGFNIPSGGTQTIRGITNTEQVSAAAATGTATIYYRTQFFSQLNSY